MVVERDRAPAMVDPAALAPPAALVRLCDEAKAGLVTDIPEVPEQHQPDRLPERSRMTTHGRRTNDNTDRTLLVIHEGDGSWSIHGLGAPGIRLTRDRMVVLVETILRQVSPASHHEAGRTASLPIGTRVWNRRPGSRARFGTVMQHEPQWSRGSFPVRWDDGFWEVLNASYVTVVPKEGGQS